MPHSLLSYEEVQQRLAAASDAPPTLLLGNGFSIACDPRYSYRALRENLEDTLPPVARGLLERLHTDNVEQVMQILEDARWVNDQLVGDRRRTGPLGRQLAAAHAATCAAMVEAIAQDHLESPAEIDPGRGTLDGQSTDGSSDRASRAVAFLAPYGTVFTTNYDLLLYWTLMRVRDRAADGTALRGNDRRWRDGFRRRSNARHGELDPEIDINVYYLHGALHLYTHQGDDQPSVRKHIGRDNLRLLDIVRRTFERQALPLFVAAGRPEQKREAIARNPYLERAYRAFSEIEGDLVLFGLSLGASDQHLLDALAGNGALGTVYVSLYGDPDSAPGLALRSTLARLGRHAADRRGRALDIHLFDSQSARPWG